MPKRVDDNHNEIVVELRLRGITVESLAPMGKGWPDIACGWHNQNYFFEIKNPDQPPSRQRLTEAESDWHGRWRGQVAVIRTAKDALRIMKYFEK